MQNHTVVNHTVVITITKDLLSVSPEKIEAKTGDQVTWAALDQTGTNLTVTVGEWQRDEGNREPDEQSPFFGNVPTLTSSVQANHVTTLPGGVIIVQKSVWSYTVIANGTVNVDGHEEEINLRSVDPRLIISG